MAVAPQSNWFKSHWPYLLGAVLLHVAIAGLFGLTMLRMQRDAPPPTLAIQAVVVDQTQLAQPQRRTQQDRERARREAEARAAEEQRRREEQAAKLEQEQQAERERQEALKQQEQEQQQREQERVRQERLVREREEQERIAKEQAAEQQRRQQEEAERQRRLEAERQAKLETERQAKLEAERKRVEEIQRKQREREEAEKRRIAAEREARERALQEQLEAEESLMRARSSPAMNQYVGMIKQHVERRWNRPPSARSGIECIVSVTQSTTGTVLRVQVGQCNADEAVKQSIENAVQRASPLPLPSDMQLFERNLQFVFKPEG